MEDIQTKHRVIGPGHPPTSSPKWPGPMMDQWKKASAIIQGVARAKADAVSIHITSIPDYMVPHYGSGKGRVSAGKEDQNIYRYLEKINLSCADWSRLIPLAKELGLEVCVMCNDWPSLEFVRACDPDMYVLSPASFVEEDFVRAMAKTGKPILLRVGGALLGEIEKVIFWTQEEGNRQMILLFGFQNYPTPIEGSHLAFLRPWQESFGFQVGLADHLDADDELALILPLLAIPFGATVIEKHVTHDRGLKGEDFESALNPEEFGKMIGQIHRIEKAIGSSHIQNIYPTMGAYRQISRKRIVAAREIQEDEILSRQDITFNAPISA